MNIDDIMNPGEQTRKNLEVVDSCRADLDRQLATLERMQELGLDLNPGDTHEDLVARVAQAEELDRQAVAAAGTDMTDEEMIARAQGREPRPEAELSIPTAAKARREAAAKANQPDATKGDSWAATGEDQLRKDPGSIEGWAKQLAVVEGQWREVAEEADEDDGLEAGR